jgi:hypothetical protein
MKRLVLSVYLMLIFVLSSCHHNLRPKTKVLQPGPEEGKDTYIQNSIRYKSWNLDSLSSLVAMTWTDDVNGSTENDARILIDFPELYQMWDDDIDSLKLTLYKIQDYAYMLGGQYGNNANRVYCISQRWDAKTVTWNNRPAFDSTASVYIPKYDHFDSVVVNLTPLLPKLMQYEYGLMIRQVNKKPWSAAVYRSCEDSIPSKRPKLTVYYR